MANDYTYIKLSKVDNNESQESHTQHVTHLTKQLTNHIKKKEEPTQKHYIKLVYIINLSTPKHESSVSRCWCSTLGTMVRTESQRTSGVNHSLIVLPLDPLLLIP